MLAIAFRAFRLLLVFASLSPFPSQAATPGIAVFSAKGSFDDVKERVVAAIENRGYVLNYTARIGDMLERTGKDIGRSAPIYGKAELVEFCSARLSRDAMEADPHNIVFCPYAIAIYTLPREPGRAYVSYRKLEVGGSPPSAKALRAVERLLEDIAREATK